MSKRFHFPSSPSPSSKSRAEKVQICVADFQSDRGAALPTRWNWDDQLCICCITKSVFVESPSLYLLNHLVCICWITKYKDGDQIQVDWASNISSSGNELCIKVVFSSTTVCRNPKYCDEHNLGFWCGVHGGEASICWHGRILFMHPLHATTIHGQTIEESHA